MPMRNKSRLLGLIIGAVLLAGGVLAVIYKPPGKTPETPPTVQGRPLKVFTVGASRSTTPRAYPGRVRASQVVDLAFQVEGPLIELNVGAGDEVQEGFVIARIDPRDYKNEWDASQAELVEKTSIFDKIKEAFDNDAATNRELIEARAQRDRADARARLTKKAYEDTFLKAPFSGRIALRYVDNFTNVLGKDRIVSLQDISYVEIEIAIPEQRVARIRNLDTNRSDREPTADVFATLDHFPGRRFEVEIKEFATEADEVTQTYAAIFTMTSPKDITILPGMTATIREYPKAEAADNQAFEVPIKAVPIAESTGQQFVWKIVKNDEGKYEAQPTEVTVGDALGDRLLLTSGVEQGDLIAEAGVYILEQGQEVVPLHSKGEDAQK